MISTWMKCFSLVGNSWFKCRFYSKKLFHLQVIKPKLARPLRIPVTACAWDHDGKHIVGGIGEGSIQVEKQFNLVLVNFFIELGIYLMCPLTFVRLQLHLFKTIIISNGVALSCSYGA